MRRDLKHICYKILYSIFKQNRKSETTIILLFIGYYCKLFIILMFRPHVLPETWRAWPCSFGQEMGKPTYYQRMLVRPGLGEFSFFWIVRSVPFVPCKNDHSPRTTRSPWAVRVPTIFLSFVPFRSFPCKNDDSPEKTCVPTLLKSIVPFRSLPWKNDGSWRTTPNPR